MSLLTAPPHQLADPHWVDRELGKGGMATACLAEHLKYQRLFALKVLQPQITEAIGVELFLR